ncbi:MAG: glycosyltransferase [Phycisphaerae bacterium]|nr:glycosyltransferase [Phycisphaerae bacterium]
MPNRKIAMVVINSISHDARVNKEAVSLVQAGYDVTILGIQDNRQSYSAEITDDGVKIIRVAWRADRHKWLFFIFLLGLFFVGIGAWYLLKWVFRLVTAIFTGNWFTSIVRNWDWASTGAIIACLVVAAGLGWVLLRVTRRVYQEYLVWHRYLAQENDTPSLQHGGFIKTRLQDWLTCLNSHVIRKQMVRRIEDLSPNVVHCHDLSALPVGVAYKKRAGCVLVYDSHEIYEELSLIEKFVKKRHEKLQRSLSRYVDSFITINDSIADYLCRKYPKLPQATIIMNATEFDPSQMDRCDERLRLAAGQGLMVRSSNVLDWVGLIEAIKTEATDSVLKPGRQIWSLFSESIRRNIRQRDLLEEMRDSLSFEKGPEQEQHILHYCQELSQINETLYNQLPNELNSLLDDPELYIAQAWENIPLPNELVALLEHHRQTTLHGFMLRRMNLLLLEAAYPNKLAQSREISKGSTKILLYQGGFARFRGLDKLIKAVELFPPDWILVMMGWGAYEEELRSIAAEIDPRNRKVKFIPPAPRKELLRWTCGATVGVIPYENVCLNHWFCTPNKLWEYPAAGVPILASPFPEMRKIVKGHKVGWLLDDPLTPWGIAHAVSSLTEEDIDRKKKCCRNFIESDNWSKYKCRLVDLYQVMKS